MIGLLWLTAAAFGGEAELEIERARVALVEERPLAAREHAREALIRGAGWRAHRIYLQACDAAGLDDVCLAGLSADADPTVRAAVRWFEIEDGREEPGALQEEGLDPELASLAAATVEIDRGHVGLVYAPSADALAGPLGAELSALEIRAHLGAGRDREVAKGVRAFLKAHPDRLDALGFLWDPRDAGKALEKARGDVAAAARAQVSRLEPEVVYRAHRLLVRAGDDEGAGATADRLVAMGEPRPLARQVWNASMRESMGRGLAMGRNPVLPDGLPSEIADVAARTATNLRDLGRAQEALQIWQTARSKADRTSLALEEAALLARMGKQKDALKAVADAIALAITPAPGDVQRSGAVARGELADGYALQAAILLAMDRPDQALPAIFTATSVDPRGEWFELRGDIQAALGHDDAAFASYAIGRALGRDIDGRLEVTFPGLGDWRPAADVIATGWASAFAPPALSVRAPVGPSGDRPRVGGRVPEWSVATPNGDISSTTLSGRVAVIAFWATWCAPCLEELPMLERLAARLETESVPVSFVGVSIDGRERDFQRFVAKRGASAMAMAWSPALGREWAVTGIPTTWVIDGEGTARHVHQGFEAGDDAALEREIRSLLK